MEKNPEQSSRRIQAPCNKSSSSHGIRYARYVATLLQNEKLPSDCHAVIWNFSPYLTTEEWLEEVKNSAEQADRLFDNGYVDPFAVFSDLVHGLNVQDHRIVFHGITSAVPILARIALRRIARKGFLVPNLSRGLNIAKAVKIA
jgi:hypothetical protein